MEPPDWTVLDTGVHTASENMSLDADLLDSLDQHALPILHFYEWKGDSATYGHFVDPSDFLDLDKVAFQGLSLAKRPTGGGIVFHIWDFAFSVLVPKGHPCYSENTLDNYAFVNNAVLSAMSGFLKDRGTPKLTFENALTFDPSCTRFCMAQPTKYDVVLNGKKIAGAAQRKTKKGFLHQGTIALKRPSVAYLKEILLPGNQVLDAILAHTFPLLTLHEDLQDGRQALKTALSNTFTKQCHHVAKS
jgi:lipoate-protein ligase A